MQKEDRSPRETEYHEYKVGTVCFFVIHERNLLQIRRLGVPGDLHEKRTIRFLFVHCDIRFVDLFIVWSTVSVAIRQAVWIHCQTVC